MRAIIIRNPEKKTADNPILYRPGGICISMFQNFLDNVLQSVSPSNKRTRHEADKVTTDATIAYILEVINQSKRNREKSICFVTGVPGAGKTLVGLDVAVKQSYQDDGTFNEDDGAVYLSGNGPLVGYLH